MRYRVIFEADKTKAIITGSQIDMKDIQMWKLYNEKINVTEENDHLGLIVSGCDEERKNVDKKHSIMLKSSVLATWARLLI